MAQVEVGELISLLKSVAEYEPLLLKKYFERRKEDVITILEAMRPVHKELLEDEKLFACHEGHVENKKRKKSRRLNSPLATLYTREKKSNTGGEEWLRDLPETSVSPPSSEKGDPSHSTSFTHTSASERSDEEKVVNGEEESGSKKPEEEEGEDASHKDFLEACFSARQKNDEKFELLLNQRIRVTYDLLNKWGKHVEGDVDDEDWKTQRIQTMAYMSIRRFVLYLYMLRSKNEGFFEMDKPFLFPRTFSHIWRGKAWREFKFVVEQYKKAFETAGIIPWVPTTYTSKKEQSQSERKEGLWRKEVELLINSIRKQAKGDRATFLWGWEDVSKLDKCKLTTLSLSPKFLGLVDKGPLPAEHPFKL
jgi:hypothetical protein